jgi:hypothetical protein
MLAERIHWEAFGTPVRLQGPHSVDVSLNFFYLFLPNSSNQLVYHDVLLPLMKDNQGSIGSFTCFMLMRSKSLDVHLNGF